MEPIRIAVVSDNQNVATMQTTMLRAAGIRDVTRFDNVDVLRSALKHFTFDLIIVNDLGRIDPYDASQVIRDEVNSKDPFAMSLLVTSKTTRLKARIAICMGYDDLLAMPFSAATMLGKINHLSKKDRKFIRVGGYFGPERRRLDEGPPNGVGERREAGRQQGQMIEQSTIDRTRKLMGKVSDDLTLRVDKAG